MSRNIRVSEPSAEMQIKIIRAYDACRSTKSDDAEYGKVSYVRFHMLFRIPSGKWSGISDFSLSSLPSLSACS